MTCPSSNPEDTGSGLCTWHTLLAFPELSGPGLEIPRACGPGHVAGASGWGPEAQQALPSTLGGRVARPSVWDKGDRLWQESSFDPIQETRWAAPRIRPLALRPSKAGDPQIWPCFALSCSLSPRILPAAAVGTSGKTLGTGCCY